MKQRRTSDGVTAGTAVIFLLILIALGTWMNGTPLEAVPYRLWRLTVSAVTWALGNKIAILAVIAILVVIRYLGKVPHVNNR
ncbi:MAG TPA: hypothetical protein VKV05_00990 [Terriglobales bacterium]|nr:hypothetical protein [Terriglobales bacterium]